MYFVLVDGHAGGVCKIVIIIDIGGRSFGSSLGCWCVGEDFVWGIILEALCGVDLDMHKLMYWISIFKRVWGLCIKVKTSGCILCSKANQLALTWHATKSFNGVFSFHYKGNLQMTSHIVQPTVLLWGVPYVWKGPKGPVSLFIRFGDRERRSLSSHVLASFYSNFSFIHISFVKVT